MSMLFAILDWVMFLTGVLGLIWLALAPLVLRVARKAELKIGLEFWLIANITLLATLVSGIGLMVSYRLGAIEAHLGIQ